jgi:putative chitinase
MKIDWQNPTDKISEFFTVGEATQNDDRRIPTPGSEVEANILALAKELDKVRKEWGSPIGVTSWYRPPTINREVGGVSNSQHITGCAADIYPLNGKDMAFEQFLDKHWGGGLGYGQASGRGFTHIDTRGGGWKRGTGTIRWIY